MGGDDEMDFLDGLTVEIGGVVLLGAQRFPVNERIHSGEIGHRSDKQFAV
jgi:hypothetical protein